MDQSFEADKHALPRGNKMISSERELLRVQAGLRDDPGCLDPKIHSDRVRDRGSAAIKKPRNVAVGPVLGTVRRYS
jgi:hypothetical protein